MRFELHNIAAGLVGASGLLSFTALPVRADKNPLRDAYFGETHVHTSWSLDAWLLGNRLTGPADSYKYFKGETIKHPAGYDIKITTPLDFAGVTDHSEYVGVIKYANEPSSPVSKLAAAQQANEAGKFTAFCSYEWTSMLNSMNMHRNVFFKACEKMPVAPFSALDSAFSEDLWNWMDGERGKGNELLAMFPK